jgi:hypothetical protein
MQTTKIPIFWLLTWQKLKEKEKQKQNPKKEGWGVW